MLDDIIEIKDGITTVEKRDLLEMTHVIVNGINKEEFIKVMEIYKDICLRLLEL